MALPGGSPRGDDNHGQEDAWRYTGPFPIARVVLSRCVRNRSADARRSPLREGHNDAEILYFSVASSFSLSRSSSIKEQMFHSQKSL